MSDQTIRNDHHKAINKMGRKEYTLLKMQEYGFWPANLPTPNERQKKESIEDYRKRKEVMDEYEKIAAQIADLCIEKDRINTALKKLKKEFHQTWDVDKVKKDVARMIMQESIERRAERKRLKELAKTQAAEAFNKQKAEQIVFIGKGYSGGLNDKKTDIDKLRSLSLPIVEDDKGLAVMLGIEYSQLRFLTYHRDVVKVDQYFRYTIPKRSGGERTIAAPKSVLKHSQRMILEKILEKITLSDQAHGFIKGRSIISGAAVHATQPELLINIDLKDFFPTITFARVRGMFKSFGYSGYISSLLAMLCTYCERMPIEVKGQIRYVKTSDRILPQGSPASPTISNILCRRLDEKIWGLARENGFTYSRYADDMSFSCTQEVNGKKIKSMVYQIQCIVYDEGFRINKEKTRYLRKHNRQSVTGIVINNEQAGVPKAWIKKLRAAIYNANRLKANGTLPSSKVYEISGMISWLSSVNKDKYQVIIADAKEIVQKNTM